MTLSEISKYTDGSHSLAFIVKESLEYGSSFLDEIFYDFVDQNPNDYIETSSIERDYTIVKNAFDLLKGETI